MNDPIVDEIRQTRLKIERECAAAGISYKDHLLAVQERFEKERIAKMVARLFDHWDISLGDQCALLGLVVTSSPVFSDGADLDFDRAGHLLGIHAALWIIFPENRDLVYKWVKTPNRRFEGKTPLELMCSGLGGLVAVRRYLDAECGR